MLDIIGLLLGWVLAGFIGALFFGAFVRIGAGGKHE